MRTLQAYDVDTDALADTFERIAEGIRHGGVMVEEVETGHLAKTDDASTFDLRIQYAAEAPYADAVDGIEYDTVSPGSDE